MEQVKDRSMGWYAGTGKGQKYGVVCWDRQRAEVWGGMVEQIKGMQKYGVVCWNRQRAEVWGGMLELTKDRSMECSLA